MSLLIEQVRIRIQDPKRTTTFNQYSPRQRSLFPPTTIFAVEAAENELGFKLPQLLSQLYTRVGNGGFGPGYGIFGLKGGYAYPIPIPPDEVDQTKGGTLTDWYFSYRGTDPQMPEPKPDTWDWFDKLLPISGHGCWQFSCIDCSKSYFPVFYFDGQQCELRPKSRTFVEWITDWLNTAS
jgi:hypothetical protein